MKTKHPLSHLGQRLYADANLFIYAIEGHSRFEPMVRRLFDYGEAAPAQSICNQVLLTEVLTKPLKNQQSELVQRYLAILEKSPNFEVVDIDRTTALEAAQLRARYGLKTIDALHLATAISYECSAFITNDERLGAVKEARPVLLESLM